MRCFNSVKKPLEGIHDHTNNWRVCLGTHILEYVDQNSTRKINFKVEEKHIVKIAVSKTAYAQSAFQFNRSN